MRPATFTKSFFSRARKTPPSMAQVELEFEREGSMVVISGRSGTANFVLALPIDGAAAFAAAAVQAADESMNDGRSRFILSRATLEVSK